MRESQAQPTSSAMPNYLKDSQGEYCLLSNGEKIYRFHGEHYYLDFENKWVAYTGALNA